ncbi:MAG TPA: undecaprenyl-diphosphate phosphatase, partial [Opitutales bacterium]|nr:undecaprenyl-diphosphate phosphatase [Opitutales bacterium]
MTLKQSLWVGFLQCFALWPGTSRSMMTIIGALSIGLPVALAAEFSFLLGFITLGAASAYKGLSLWKLFLDGLPWGPMALGFVVSTVCAFFAIKWLIGFLTRYGLTPFAYYRILLG